MTPNPFSGLVHSRKFWLAVVDAIAAILALWVSSYVEPKLAQLILATWAAFQPVLIVVIMAIAYEDKANVMASAQVEAQAIWKTDADCKDDDCRAELTAAYEKGLADGKA